MIRQIKTKIYSFHQMWDPKETKLKGLVLIEAIDCEHANCIAQKIGVYFDGREKGIDHYASDRWHGASGEGSDTVEEASEFYKEYIDKDDYEVYLLETFESNASQSNE